MYDSLHYGKQTTDDRSIEASGLNFKALERETGVTRQSLMAFMKGQRTLRLDIADQVANYFGLAVGAASKAKRKVVK